MEKLGWTYQDLTNFILNEEKPTPDTEVKHIRQELNDFKKQTEDERKRIQEEADKRAQAQAQEAETRFKEEISEYLAGKPDDFELIAKYEQEPLVYDTIAAHYDKTKKVLSIEEASKLVEAHLAAPNRAGGVEVGADALP